MLIGNMAWKLGTKTLPEQIIWAGKNDFKAVSFHTNKHLSGGGCGIDPETCHKNEFENLKKALEGFQQIDIHAPFDNFDVILTSLNERVRKASVDTINASVKFASRIKASTVTVHPGNANARIGLPKYSAVFLDSLNELEQVAAEYNIFIGVEVDTKPGYELVYGAGLPHVGLTLDTGHMCFENGRGYREFGTIENVIRKYADKLFHVHIHDYDGKHDHLPPRQGNIDFKEIIAALNAIKYTGNICLELSPLYAQEKEIIDSKKYLEELITEA